MEAVPPPPPPTVVGLTVELPPPPTPLPLEDGVGGAVIADEAEALPPPGGDAVSLREGEGISEGVKRDDMEG